MKEHERRRGLLRGPRLLWDVLARGRYDFVFDRMPVSASGMTLSKRANLALAGVNLLYRRLQPWNMPLHMQFELTSFCNLRCPVCPAGARELEREGVSMDPALFERVFDEVGPYLLTASLWAWGEPLLHPGLRRILRAARRHPVVTLVSTNGLPLRDEGVIEALIEEPPSCLIVAIDGLTDETNSKFRVGAALEPILRGVRRLAELKRKRGARLPLLHMRFMVMRHNEHEVPRLESFAREHGFELLTLRTLSIFDTGAPESVHTGFVPRDARWRPYEYRGEVRRRRDDFICQQPFWFPSLYAGGELVACEQDHSARHAFGGISGDTTFRDIWFGKGAAEVRRLIRDHWRDAGFCRNCPFADRPATECSVAASQIAPDDVYPGLMPVSPPGGAS